MSNRATLTQQLRHAEHLLSLSYTLRAAQFDQRAYRSTHGDVVTMCLAGLATEHGIGGLQWTGHAALAYPRLAFDARNPLGSLEHVFGEGAFDALFGGHLPNTLHDAQARLASWIGTLQQRLAQADDFSSRDSVDDGTRHQGAVTDAGNALDDGKIALELSLPTRTIAFIDELVEQTTLTRDAVIAVLLALGMGRSTAIAERADDAIAAGQAVASEDPHWSRRALDEPELRDVTDTPPKLVTPDMQYRIDDKTVVSYGPRRETLDATEPCHADDAAFWSVFTHDSDGHAQILCDCTDFDSAKRCAYRLWAELSAQDRLNKRIVELTDQRESYIARVNNLTRQNEQQFNALESIRKLIKESP